MRRREFITLLGGAAAAGPLGGARAQQRTLPMIGFLRSVSLTNAAPLVTAFRDGLKETGFVEGQNVAIEFRTAEGHNDRLPALVSDLIRLPVTAIFCNTVAAQVVKAATASIPIYFHNRKRSGQGRPRRQPKSAGWKPDRGELFLWRARRKATGTAARAPAQGYCNRLARKPSDA